LPTLYQRAPLDLRPVDLRGEPVPREARGRVLGDFTPRRLAAVAAARAVG
jgi:hypothetical protein